jgi:DNA gyrase subunit A
MGRATSGVLGMRFKEGDELLTLGVVRADTFLLVATNGGYAKRTPIEDYPVQGRGGKGVLTVQYDSKRGRLVGALIVDVDDEVFAITSAGGVIRTSAREVRKAGRQTKGVRLMNLGDGTTLVAIARSAEVSENGAEIADDVDDADVDADVVTDESPAESNADTDRGVITNTAEDSDDEPPTES